MIVSIAKGKPNGSVVAPPSKSYAHRMIIAGMLSGSSCIENVSFSEDVEATLSCAKALGFSFRREMDSLSFLNHESTPNYPILPCRESGSTLRFFLPVALLFSNAFALEGTSRLLERGVAPYEHCLEQHGIALTRKGNRIEVEGFLKPGVYEIDASSSSQCVTGLLFALPCLGGNSRIRFLGEVASWPYVEMTLSVLDEFGIRYERLQDGFSIPGKQHYEPRKARVEGDYSNAAFLSAFASLGSDVFVTGLSEMTKQGDSIYKSYFSKLSQGFAELPVSNCIDLCPVLFAFAALKHGGKFLGTKRLALKESNRAEAMKEELAKAGAAVLIGEDEVTVQPTCSFPNPLRFSSHNDHRIAMALSLFSLVSSIEIEGAECVAKSYPDYFRVLSSLGLEVETHE